jgi:hypothetical protein
MYDIINDVIIYVFCGPSECCEDFLDLCKPWKKNHLFLILIFKGELYANLVIASVVSRHVPWDQHTVQCFLVVSRFIQSFKRWRWWEKRRRTHALRRQKNSFRNKVTQQCNLHSLEGNLASMTMVTAWDSENLWYKGWHYFVFSTYRCWRKHGRYTEGSLALFMCFVRFRRIPFHRITLQGDDQRLKTTYNIILLQTRLPRISHCWKRREEGGHLEAALLHCRNQGNVWCICRPRDTQRGWLLHKLGRLLSKQLGSAVPLSTCTKIARKQKNWVESTLLRKIGLALVRWP